MKYYLHDTSAFQDEKITLLYMKFGFEAVGLFYCILEKLALQEKPVSEEVIKTQLNIKKRLKKQLDFMYEIEILSVRNGEVFNENLLNFSKKYQIKKEKTRKKVSEWRRNKGITKNVTSYKPVRNHLKVNKSKVKENKDNIYTQQFEKFWSLYPKRNGKKVGKVECLKFTKKFSNDDFELLITATNFYSLSKIAKDNYARDPIRFLKNDYWRDWVEGNGKTDEFDFEKEATERYKRIFGDNTDF